MSRSFSKQSDLLFGDQKSSRFFFNFFKSKKKKVRVRPGALQPNEVKKIITEIGKDKEINIRRVEFDGATEANATILRILDIRDEYFTGQIVNVERSIKQELDNKVVYIKGGGGNIDFYYDEGDILSIEEDIDETIFEQRNVDEMLAILDALDLNESILVSYYDKKKSGVMNGVGRLLEKDLDQKTFKVELLQINGIELDHPKTLTLHMDEDKVLDLEVML